MKAATLNGKQAVILSHKLNDQGSWILSIRKLMRFFDDAYESDGKEAGLSWKVSFFG